MHAIEKGRIVIRFFFLSGKVFEWTGFVTGAIETLHLRYRDYLALVTPKGL